MDTNVTVAAADGIIVLGFSTPQFSQCIYIPVESVEQIQLFGMELFNSLVTAAETVLNGVINGDAPINDSTS